jgi:hypothetical protein
MPTHTITRGLPFEGAIHSGDHYEFRDYDETFVGHVLAVVPDGESHLQITLSMTADEYGRLPVTQG